MLVADARHERRRGEGLELERPVAGRLGDGVLSGGEGMQEPPAFRGQGQYLLEGIGLALVLGIRGPSFGIPVWEEQAKALSGGDGLPEQIIAFIEQMLIQILGNGRMAHGNPSIRQGADAPMASFTRN
jgi:hypothetical protein